MSLIFSRPSSIRPSTSTFEVFILRPFHAEKTQGRFTVLRASHLPTNSVVREEQAEVPAWDTGNSYALGRISQGDGFSKNFKLTSIREREEISPVRSEKPL